MKSLRLIVSGVFAVTLVVGLSGCGKSASPTNVTNTLDTSPPAAPAGLVSSSDGSTGRATLAWDPSSDADVASYRIFVYSPDPARDNAYVETAEVPAGTTSFVTPAVNSSVVQYFRVRAVDQSGNVSGFSNQFSMRLDPSSGGAGGPGGGRIRE